MDKMMPTSARSREPVGLQMMRGSDSSVIRHWLSYPTSSTQASRHFVHSSRAKQILGTVDLKRCIHLPRKGSCSYQKPLIGRLGECSESDITWLLPRRSIYLYQSYLITHSIRWTLYQYLLTCLYPHSSLCPSNPLTLILSGGRA